MKQYYSKPEMEMLLVVEDGILCQSSDYTVDPLNPREDWPSLF